MLSSSTKRENGHFHVVAVQWRQRNVQKSVMRVQSCCFTDLSLWLFCRSSNIGHFFWGWILTDLSKVRKIKRKSLCCALVLHKTWKWAFSRRSRAMTVKKCTKKRDARAKLLFYRSKPVAFLPFSKTSPLSLLTLPNCTLLRVHQGDPIKMTG